MLSANLDFVLCCVQVLGLASTQVGDTVVSKGVVHCKQLVKLNLSHTRITDKSTVTHTPFHTRSPQTAFNIVLALFFFSYRSRLGLKHLKNMHLAQVNLDRTGVSLTGIANLLSFTNIISIRASNPRTIPLDEVSDEEWEAE